MQIIRKENQTKKKKIEVENIWYENQWHWKIVTVKNDTNCMYLENASETTMRKKKYLKINVLKVG